MSFKSLDFLIFFPVVIMLYFFLPHRWRWLWLLTASYYFYMCWKPVYALLLVATTLIDYWAGLQMGKESNKAKRKKFFLISLVSNLGMLFFFKYYNFFFSSIGSLASQWNILYQFPEMHVLLPVGISFYVFQSVGYSIDVYRGVKAPEKHPGIFALYVVFFPQLVAGPIERSTHLLPQFYQTHDFDYRRVTDGLRLMAWGFFKKVVIADRLAVYVNASYNSPAGHTGLEFILATVFFAYQIYCDFSGYSDIAIGAAKVLGFDLMQNFRSPFWATSVGDFWQRWHISLSTWLRDYLYTPLSIWLRDLGIWGAMLALMITFVLCGLWHGPTWNFLVFGFLFGVALCYELLTKKIWKKIWKRSPKFVATIVSIFCTFSFVCFAFIFFRANSMADALYIIKSIGDLLTTVMFRWHDLQGYHWMGYYQLEHPLRMIMVNFLWIAFLEGAYWLAQKRNVNVWISSRPWYVRWGVYYSILAVIIFCGYFEESRFIYFQF